MSFHGKNFIGSSLSQLGTNAFQATNPATGEKLETKFYDATDSEIQKVADLAEAAFPVYRAKSKEARGAFLEQIAEEIMLLGEPLLQMANSETGLPIDRLTGERGRTVNSLKLFASLIREGSWVEASIDTAIPDRTPLPKPDLRKMLVPIGPVAVFGASNFPLAFSTAGGDTASALAAGCPVIVKAHPAHPGTAAMVAEAVLKAVQASQMPEGTFSMVQGIDNKVSISLVKNTAIKAVGFTGSLKGGRALFDACASRPEPIPVFAEMGSVNPVFVLPGALAERGEKIAEGLKNSVTASVGQFCTCPGLVVGLDSPELNKFADNTASLIKEVAPGTMLHPGILSSYKAGISKLEKATGVETIKASTKADERKTQATANLFLVDAKNFLANPELSQEVFGPSTVMVSCNSKAELEKIAIELEGHLTATIHGTEKDLEEYKTLLSILETKAGRLIINGFPTGVEVCPSMTHGGPYPSTTDSRTTSVGTGAIKRFVRPVSYQAFPDKFLPLELQAANPLKLWRTVNNELSKD